MGRSSKEKQEGEAAWWQPSLILFSRLSGWIGGPIIVALFVGKWLDERYKTEPWLFLLSIGIAFIASSIGIVKEGKAAMDVIVEEEESKSMKKGRKKDSVSTKKEKK